MSIEKIVLTVEITANGESIGDKENVCAALERFGAVRVLEIEERAEPQQTSFWDESLRGTPFEGRIKKFW